MKPISTSRSELPNCYVLFTVNCKRSLWRGSVQIGYSAANCLQKPSSHSIQHQKLVLSESCNCRAGSEELARPNSGDVRTPT